MRAGNNSLRELPIGRKLRENVVEGELKKEKINGQEREWG